MGRARQLAPLPTSIATEAIRFAPDILRRLGEELVSSIDIGVIELVKNAYDADARTCRVELHAADQPGGVLTVADDGSGMSLDAIRSGWLVLGRSGKSPQTRTPLGRVSAGDKGLGRLAALRLGARAVLETRPAAEPGVEYVLSVNWSDFDAAQVVEDVPIDIERRTTDRPAGTSITVQGLHRAVKPAEVEQLARALLLLSDPFANGNGFRATLVGSGFDDLERRVHDAWFDQADYRLRAELDADGRAHFQAWDLSGQLRWEYRSPENETPYHTVPAVFELWAFILDAKRYTPRNVGLPEVKAWLKAVGGVHLYHRGLRVAPYGEPGHDWLELNLARARNPELRPSTNTSIGRVVVADVDGVLRQKTDRSGFIADEAFSQLVRFAQDATDWMADCRLKERESHRQAERQEAPVLKRSAEARLKKTLKKLAPEQAHAVELAVEEVQKASARQVAALEHDVALYRTLATVGVTTSLFAHDTGATIELIRKSALQAEKRGKLALGAQYPQQLGSLLTIIQKSASSLDTWTALPMSLLPRKKREIGPVEVNLAIRNIVKQLKPFLDEVAVSLELDLADPGPRLYGTVAGIEAVVANLLSNAIKALQRPNSRPDPRRIQICTSTADLSGRLSVADNGPGIKDIPLDDIWLPGKSAFKESTGLGLTIVRDVAQDLGGRAWALPNGELGGAIIGIDFPLWIGGRHGDA